ncbi:SdiA-regulated domain-containing protein [uncultured Marixanthomonas sp.]|uniref:SdiA-regulated domain-containing protein n=1 Tax=uncultured Marixanthomonas sp. TaxID=757245 RepID=UPI0030D942FA
MNGLSKHMNKIVAVLAIIIIAVSFLFYHFYKSRIEEKRVALDSTQEVVESWELPSILDEISGIVWLEDGRIACIQDEVGIVFFYNLKTKKLDGQVKFAGDGDYEGLALMGKNMYVVRSDGEIFELLDFLGEDPVFNQYELPLSEKHNIETLLADEKNNRLLLMAKDHEPFDNDGRGIYGYDLETKNLLEKPVLLVTSRDAEIQKTLKKIRPSDIAIHPKTKEIYVLQGTKPRIIIVSPDGVAKQEYPLNNKVFYQPEGITFSPDGTLYISNEATGGVPSILKVELK